MNELFFMLGAEAAAEKLFEQIRPVKVIFNGPATIVYWADGVKTVVKAQDGEPFDQEKGLAMAMIKRLFGNTGRYNEIFKKFCGDIE